MMNDASQVEQTSSTAACDATDTKLAECQYVNCSIEFTKKPKKKFCSSACKNADYNINIELGKKQRHKGRIHFAKIENSDRLQRVAKYLSDGKAHTTRDIIINCDVCAVSAIVQELRENGFGIDCKCIRHGVFEYKMLYDINTPRIREKGITI